MGIPNRDSIRRHVIHGAEKMMDEAVDEFGDMKAELTFQDEIHLHIALILLNRVLLRRYGFVPHLLKDSL